MAYEPTYKTPKQILLNPENAFVQTAQLSSDNVVADADGKKIIKAGTVVEGDGFLLDPKTILSVQAPTVSVTGINLVTASPLSLKVGASSTIQASVQPDNATDKAITLVSADPTIATVDNSGNVTGVKAGETDITLASHADNTKTVKIHIVVTA